MRVKDKTKDMLRQAQQPSHKTKVEAKHRPRAEAQSRSEGEAWGNGTEHREQVQGLSFLVFRFSSLTSHIFIDFISILDLLSFQNDSSLMWPMEFY